MRPGRALSRDGLVGLDARPAMVDKGRGMDESQSRHGLKRGSRSIDQCPRKAEGVTSARAPAVERDREFLDLLLARTRLTNGSLHGRPLAAARGHESSSKASDFRGLARPGAALEARLPSSTLHPRFIPDSRPRVACPVHRHPHPVPSAPGTPPRNR